MSAEIENMIEELLALRGAQVVIEAGEGEHPLNFAIKFEGSVPEQTRADFSQRLRKLLNKACEQFHEELQREANHCMNAINKERAK